MAKLIKYVTAAAIGYAMRAYSNKAGHNKNHRGGFDARNLITDAAVPFLVERIFNSLWPQKQEPQRYRKVPFSNRYVPDDKPKGFHHFYRRGGVK